MIKLEDTTMTKKQYFIPQVETLPLFNANALCAGSGTPTPATGGDSFTVGGGGDPTQAF